jgi:hypothetical protein
MGLTTMPSRIQRVHEDFADLVDQLSKTQRRSKIQVSKMLAESYKKEKGLPL